MTTPPGGSGRRGSWRQWATALAWGASIAALASLLPLGDAFGLASLVAATTIVAWVAWRNPGVRAPLVVAFALRSLGALSHVYGVQLPGAGLDAVTFERIGWEFAQSDWRTLRGSISGGAFLYSWIIAVLYWLTARSPLLIEMVNVLLGTLVVYEVHVLAGMMWSDADARRAAWVAALFPTMVLYSAITLREMLVAYPLVLGAVWLARWRVTGRLRWVVGAMGAFIVGIAFHTMMFGAILFVLGTAAARWMSTVKEGQLRQSVGILAGLVLAGAAGLYILASGLGAGNFAYTDVFSSTDLIAAQQLGTGDRASYLQGMMIRSFGDLLWQAPIRTFFFLFMPFPWIVSAVIDLVGLIDAALYVVLCVCALRRLRVIWSTPVARLTALLWASCAVVFGLVVTNYGTAIRHRGKLAPLLIAVAIVGVPHRPRQRTLTVPASDVVA